MINYDNYKNRIEKLAKAKRVAHKFRFLIAGVALLLVGGSVGLMCAKGAYTSEMTLSAQTVEFNQPYTVKPASAFLASASSQRIEYREENSEEWTEEKPVKAGKYLARTVSPKLIGYSYSQPVEFEITPRDVKFEILGNVVVYGEVPDCEISDLVAGHKIDETSLLFNYADYGAAHTQVDALPETLKIVDSSGEDFTCCYNVTFSGKELDVLPRTISVKTVDNSFVYDGATHSASDDLEKDTLSRLAAGDTMSVQTQLIYNGMPVAEALNAGSYQVRIISFTVMHGNIDVTQRYSAGVPKSALLTVEKRDVAVSSSSDKKSYDGKPLTNGGVSVENLVGGHRYEIAGELPFITDCGIVNNDIQLNFFDAEGNVVTDNYRQILSAGTLEIERRKLTVTTQSYEVKYNGNPLSDYLTYQYTLSENLADFEFKAVIDRSQTRGADIGSYENRFDIVATLNGADVTDNFDFKFNAGKIDITRRSLTISTGSDDKVYDGTPLSCDAPVYSGEVSGHTLSVSKPFSVTNVTSGEGVKNAIRYAITDESGADVTKNYEINYVDGTLKIEKRRISVTTADDGKEYDGVALENAGYTATWLDGYAGNTDGLCGSDILTVISSSSITQKGKVPNVCAYSLPLFDGANSNYELVATNYGTLEIKPKKVTVTIDSVQAVYGEKLPEAGFNLNCSELPNGEILSFDTDIKLGSADVTPAEWQGYSLLDVNDGYTIAVNGATVKVTGGNASAANYDFTFVRGKLEILARKIVVTTATDEKYYDGTPLENDTYRTVWADNEQKAGLLNGDLLIKDTNNTVINPPVAGPYDNVCYYKSPNNNYEISEHRWGKLTIKPRPVIVYTDSDDKVYDGTALICDSFTTKFAVQDESTKEWTADESKVGLIAGDTLTLIGVPVSITDAGETKNSNKYQNGNYNIVGYVDGTLTIFKKEVNIKLTDSSADYGMEEEYNGLRGQGTGFIRTDGSYDNPLADGEELFISVGFKKGGVEQKLTADGVWKLAVGNYASYAVEYKLYKNGGTEPDESGKTLKNYKINCGEGELVINPRGVTVNINNATATYGDDVAKIKNGFTLSVSPLGGTALPYEEKLTLTYKYDREVKYVGDDYGILRDKVYIDGEEIEDIDDCNYAFTFNKGTLTISAKTVYVYINDNTCEYGEALPEPDWWLADRVNESEFIKIETLPYGDVLEPVDFKYYTGDNLENTVNYGFHNDKPRLNVGVYNCIQNSVSENGDLKHPDYRVIVAHVGSLSVTHAPLNITLPEITGITYGDEWAYPDAKTVVTGLKYEETLTVAVKFKSSDGTLVKDSEGNFVIPKNAGEYSILLDEDNCLVKNKDLTDGLLSNYEVKAVDGSLTIAKRDVHVLFNPHYYYVTYGDPLPEEIKYGLYEKFGEYDTEYELPYGEVMTFTYRYKISGSNEEYVDTPKNVNHYEVKVSGIYVGGVLQTQENCNYHVIIDEPWEAAIIIEAKTVVPVIEGFSEVYGDEIPYDFKQTETHDENGNEILAYGEQAFFKVKYLSGGKEVTPENKGEYDIEITEYIIKDKDGNEIEGGAGNYNFQPECGKLTIIPRQLKITLNDNEITYGDEASAPSPVFANLEGGVTDAEGKYGLPYGDEIGVSLLYNGVVASNVKDAGDYEITVSEWNVTSGNKNKENYGIEWVSGTLTVNRRTVNIKIEPKSLTYGVTPPQAADFNLILNGETVHNGTLWHDETLTVSVIYYKKDGVSVTPRNVGEYTVVADSFIVRDKNNAVVDEGAADKLKNYVIVCEEGTLAITPKKITVELNRLTTPVDYGETFNYSGEWNNHANSPALEYGEEMKVAVKYSLDKGFGEFEAIDSPKNAGLYFMELDLEKCAFRYKADGVWAEVADGYNNYEIECEGQSLRINVREITVTPYSFVGDDALFYGDLGVSFNYPDQTGNYQSYDGLQYNETLKIKVRYTMHGAELNVRHLPSFGVPYDIEVTDEFEVYDENGNKIDETSGGRTQNYRLGICSKGKLQINPRKVTVELLNLDPIAYGEFTSTTYPDEKENYVTIPYPDLAKGEQLRVSVIYIDSQGTSGVTPRNVGVYSIDGGSFTVYNEDGELLGGEGNYVIEWDKGSLEIIQKEINFVIRYKDGKNVVYYGDEISAPDVELWHRNSDGASELFMPPYNETFTAEWVYEAGHADLGYVYGEYSPVAVEAKNVGAYLTYPKTIYVNGNESGVSNYKIRVAGGSFNIVPREITVELSPVSDVDYGETLSYAAGKGNYANQPDFAYGEDLEVAVKYLDGEDNVVASPKNAGTYSVALDLVNCVIYDKDGVEIQGGTSNYSITCANLENVKINRLKVAVTVDNQTCVYGTDAETLVYTSKVTIKGVTVECTDEIALVHDEVAGLKYERISYENGAVVKAIDCGKYALRASVDKSFDKNYEFSFTNGEFEITKKTLTIKLNDVCVEYGDLPFSYGFSGDLPVYENQSLVIDTVEYYDGDGNAVLAPKAVGTYRVKAVIFELYDYDSSERPEEKGKGDEFINYIIVCGDGELTVSKRNVTVTVSDNGWVYGDSNTHKNSFTVDLEDGMPYNEEFVLTYAYVPENPVNAGNYPIKGTVIGVNDENGNAIEGGLGSYNIIEVKDGNLEITQRAVTIDIQNGTMYYGDTPDIKYTVDGTLAGETLTLAFSFYGGAEVLNIGTYSIIVETLTVTGGNANADNYYPEYVNDAPTLTVVAKPVVVTLTGDSYVYGERMPNPTFTTDCTLPNGETFELTYSYLKEGAAEATGAPKAAGIYKISADYKVVGGNASKANYAVTYADNDPRLIINKKQITIQLNARGRVNFEYGDDYSSALSEVQIPAGDLVDGQIIKVKINYSVKQAARALKRRAAVAKAEEFIPVNAGTYIATLDFNNCRVYERDGVILTDGGIENYELAAGFTPDPVEFTIQPKKVVVTISDKAITYGDNLPADEEINYVTDVDLVGEETLKLAFSYGDGVNSVKNVDKYAINVVSEEIVNGTRSNYDISYSRNAMLEIEQKELTVDVKDFKNQPFGKEFTYPDGIDNCVAHGAIDGEHIKITVKFVYEDGNEVVKPYNAGTYDIIMTDFTVCDGKGNEIVGGKDNYLLKDEGKDGVLIIDSANVIVNTIGNEKVYDGTPITNKGFTVEGALVGGDQVQIKELWRGQIDVTDGVEDKSTYKIVDKNGNESFNYNLEVRGGTLIITPMEIEIKTESDSKEYDGTKLTAPYDKTLLTLASGDEMKITKVAEITDAGTSENFVEFIIENASGKDVTKNYKIKRTFGTLTVRSFAVTVSLPYKNGLPYGEELEDKPTLSRQLPNGEAVTFDVIYTKSGENTVIADGGTFLLDAGTYVSKVDETSVKVNGDSAKATNYSFTFMRGRVQVVARKIIVTSATDEHEYDGAAFINSGYTTVYATDEKKAGLLNGDELTVLTYAKITDVGSIPNDCTYEVQSDNYEIVKVNSGTLTVNKRAVTVTTGSILNGVYNGTAYSTDRATAGAGDLVLNHTLKAVLPLFEQVDATDEKGEDNKTEFTVVDGNGDDVSGNYEISYNYGKIIVKPAEITVTTGSILNGVYNGAAYSTEEGSLKSGTLYLGATLAADKDTVTEVIDATDDEGVANETEFKVFVGSTDVTKNYKISYDNGRIVVKPAAVTIALNGNIEDEYGKGLYSSKLAKDAVSGLVNGETAQLSLNYFYQGAPVSQPKNAGEYTAEADWTLSLIRRKDGTFGKVSNYKLTSTPASVTFKITQKQVTVKLNGGVKVVYGDEYEDLLTQNAVSGTVGGEKLNVVLTYTGEQGAAVTQPKNKGVYTAAIDWDNCSVSGGLLSNYALAPESAGADFEITAKKLNFKMDDLTVAYGKPIVYPAGAGNYYGTCGGLLSGEYLEVVAAYEKNGVAVENPQFAGEYDIVCSDIIIRDASGNEIAGGADNYDFTEAESGLLTIEGVNVIVTRKTVKKIYDGSALVLQGTVDEVYYKYTTADGEQTQLPEGYSLKMVKGCSTPDGNANGEGIDNTAEYAIYEGTQLSGKYVVAGYEEDEEGSKLIIEQRPVNIKTFGDSKTYDGTKLTAGYDYADGNIYELLEGHTFKVNSQTEITDVDKVKNEYDLAVFADETDVTANYDVTITEYGMLEITVKNITVTLGNLQPVYGGEIEKPEATLSEELIKGTLSYDVFVAAADDESNTPITIEKDDDGYTLLDVGTYKLVADEDSVAVAGDKKENYKFTFVSGQLKVGVRRIVVITDDLEKEYDGEPLYAGGYTTHLEGDENAKGLIGGDLLIVNEDELISKGFTDVNAEDKTNEFAVAVPNSNYEIADTVYGYMLIYGRVIVISTGSVGVNETVVYDGQEHFNKTGSLSEGTLVNLHSIKVDEDTVLKLINATSPEGEDNTTEFKVYDANNKDVSANYDIGYDYGKIIIAPAYLKVTINKGGKVSFEYGDDTIDAQMKDFTSGDLVGDDELQVAIGYDTGDLPVDVNEGYSYTAYLDIDNSVVVTNNGTDIENGISNYDIDCDDVTFDIVRKKVTLTLGGVDGEFEKEYDGEAFEYDESQCVPVSGSSFAYGETLNGVTVIYKDKNGDETDPIDAGEYTVELSVDDTFMSNDMLISDNYEVTCTPAKLTVSKREIQVKLSDVEHVYDGNAYDFDLAEEGFEVINLVNGDELARTVTYSADSPVQVGDYTITFNGDNLQLADGSEANNYVLAASGNTLSCKLTINKREITVEVADRTEQQLSLDYVLNNVYGTADLTSELSDGSEGYGFAPQDLLNSQPKFTATLSEEQNVSGATVYDVSVSFDAAVISKNYTVTLTEGTLRLTDRWIKLSVDISGEFTYDGNPIALSAFKVVDKHMPDCTENGFTDAEKLKLNFGYVFTNVDNEEDVYSGGATPVNAGDYIVTIVMTVSAGNEAYFKNYLIETEDETVTINRRNVTLKTVNDGGEALFTYSNSKPEIKVEVKDVSNKDANEGFIGAMPEYALTYLLDGVETTRFNAGKYTVGVEFTDCDNYEINLAEAFEFEITRRTVVVMPVHPNGGKPIDYAGSPLALGENDFKLAYGSAAEGDKISISSTELPPTRVNGTVQIKGVKATDINDVSLDVTQNYVFIYDRAGAIKYVPTATVADFKVFLEYKKMTLEYNQVVDGKTFEYDGTKKVYTFTGSANEVVQVLNDSLYSGHTLALRTNSYTADATAGETAGWLNGLLRIKDANGNDVTAIYSFDCKNATDAGKPIIVEKVEVTVTITGITSADITERVTVLSGEKYTTSQLAENVGVSVYAFNVRGEKSLGVTVYKTQGSAKVDLMNNYEVTIVNNTDIAVAKLLSLAEAENLTYPTLDVTFNGIITADDLNDGSIFHLDADGCWKLNSDCYKTLIDGVESSGVVEVIVIKTGETWSLGVTVSGENALGNKVDARSSYNLGQLQQFDGISVSYISLTEASSARKLLYVDFSNAFTDNGDGTYMFKEELVENGILKAEGYECLGLNAAENHLAEVSVEDDGNGNYAFTVKVFIRREVAGRVVLVDQYSKYSFNAVIPAGATANATIAPLN